ncbi:hypothetical protein SUDANB6_03116 [Streptomyces sp. enrichment culture]
MGFLTLLRNAFGRSRKAKTAPAEGAVPQPATEPAADPATGTAPDPATEPAPAPTAEPPAAPAAEEASPEHAAESSPAPRPAAPEEHELVVAAFDKVVIPRPSRTPEREESTGSGTEAKETVRTPEPATSETEPSPDPATATAETDPAADSATPGTDPTPDPQPAPESAVPTSESAVPAQASESSAPAPASGSAAPESEAPAPASESEAPVQTPEAPAPTPESTVPTSESPTPASGSAAPESEAPVQTPESPTPAPESAAHGEKAPQESPVPGDESRTEGTGGTASPAEGETEGEGEAEVRKPAVSAARLRSRAPHLSPAYKAAGAVLRKRGLTGTRAKVYLVLDRSSSMRPYYKDGSAQALAEQTLALAAHLDPEATVPVVFFSTELDGTGELTLTGHENRIAELHGALGRMGRTSYHAAVAEVVARHAEHQKAAPGTPALVVFQTDGAPDAKTPATRALTEAAQSHPSLFFSFVAFGDPENKAFEYLRKLRTGNASHFLAGEAPRELTDKEMYEGLLASWRP